MARPAPGQAEQGSVAAGLAARLPFFYGWVILAVAVVGMFASGPGQASILSVFIEPIGRDTGWSRTVISAALSLGTFATALAMPLAGDLFERFGARLVIAATAFLLGLGCLLMSRAETEAGLYAGMTAVRLLGLGVISLTCTTLVARWFVRRRGRAMAAAVIGMAIGLAAFPPVLTRIIEASGWRAAWVAMAVVVWVLVIGPTLLLVRNRPEDLGLRPDGDSASPAASARQTSAGAAPRPSDEPAWQVRDVIRQRNFWLLLLATAIPFFVNVAVTFHQVPFLLDNGLTAREAAFTVSFYAICFSFGSLGGGWLADRFAPRSALVGTLILQAGAVVVLMNAQSIASAGAYGVTFGLAAGANSTIERVVWPAYYGREHLGRINGLVMLIRMIAGSSGPLLAGMVYDQLGSYGPFFIGMAILPLICAAVAALVGPPAEHPARRKVAPAKG